MQSGFGGVEDVEGEDWRVGRGGSDGMNYVRRVALSAHAGDRPVDLQSSAGSPPNLYLSISLASEQVQIIRA